MKKTIEFKRGSDFTNKVFEEYPSGNLKIVCPYCKEEMLVILDREAVVKHQRSEGMYCPNGHVQVVYNMKGNR